MIEAVSSSNPELIETDEKETQWKGRHITKAPRDSVSVSITWEFKRQSSQRQSAAEEAVNSNHQQAQHKKAT